MKQKIIKQKLLAAKVSLSAYRKFSPFLAKLRGKRVVYFSATPAGGGVAELLKNVIPTLKRLGVEADWYTMPDLLDFFRVSKKMHNSLQGSKEKLTAAEKSLYLRVNKSMASQLARLKPDVLMIQDLQPLGVLNFLPPGIQTVARIHIDLTNPNPDSLRFINPFLRRADKLVFTLKDYVPKSLRAPKVYISPPAIDPNSLKNLPLKRRQLEAVAEAAGIDPSRLLLVQVSRFDKWKDPLGVIQAYRLVKDVFPQTQLALVGVMEAQDDPEAAAVLTNVKKYAAGDKDVLLFYDKSQFPGIKLDVFVNAMQRLADVVLQKSVREGFGLTVTEAMWKGKPVIGGNVGGIKLQIKDKKNGFLAATPKQAANAAIKLLANKKLARAVGRQAILTVKKNYLISRYVTDELKSMA